MANLATQIFKEEINVQMETRSYGEWQGCFVKDDGVGD